MLVLSNQLRCNFLFLDLIDKLDGSLDGVEQSYLELDRRFITPVLQKEHVSGVLDVGFYTCERARHRGVVGHVIMAVPSLPASGSRVYGESQIFFVALTPAVVDAP